MADDLYDAFGDGDVYFDEEGEEGADVAEGEGQNRMFLFIAGGMALVTVCAIVFGVLWATMLSPAARQRVLDAQLAASVTETPTAVVESTNTPTVTPTNTATPTPTPTPTSTPTPTPVVGSPATPETDDNGEAPGEGDNGDTEGTPAAPSTRRTSTPTPTPRFTPTPRSDAGGTGSPASTAPTMPDTGLGEIALVLGGLFILGVVFLLRQLRKA